MDEPLESKEIAVLAQERAADLQQLKEAVGILKTYLGGEIREQGGEFPLLIMILKAKKPQFH